MGNMNELEPGKAQTSREHLLSLLLASEARRRKRNRAILSAGKRTGPTPLSYAQERLWFLGQLGLVGVAYNVPVAVRLSGALREPALEQSFEELVRRHESLRTRFVTQDGVPYQIVEAPGAVGLQRVDLSHIIDSQEKERQLRELMRHEQLHQFDLCEGSPWRAVLIKLGASDHALVLTMHHIVVDGWSLEILLNELSVLYAASVRGQPSPLSEPTLQYADYATWHRQWLQEEVMRDQLSYWVERLREAPSQLQLPTDRPRPALESFKGAALSFDLPATLSRALKKLGRTEEATLFMVILTAYSVLLSRWSGQRDIVVGSPIAGRRHREVEGVIGLFVNMLALRIEVAAKLTFRQLLGRVKAVTLGAYAHQDLPFEALVKELRPDRDLARQPIIQVVLALENYQEEGIELPEITATRIDRECVNTHFDLTLYLSETRGSISGLFEYATDLFDRLTIERMAGHLQTLLEAIVINPDGLVDQLPLLTADEQHHLVVQWNQTTADHPRGRCVHELFREQAKRTPRAIALVQDHRQVTYEELEARSNQLGHYLRSLGVGPEVIVGLYVERSVEMLTGMLGILKAGGAYLPLDPTYPNERLNFMLKDSSVSLLLTQTGLAGKLADHLARAVVLDKGWESIASASTEPPEKGVNPQALAYVIYTSGSTGTPKAVGMPHEPLCNHMAWMIEHFGFSSSDVVLQKTPLSFDASVWEVFAPLLCGARLILARPDGHRDPAYLCRTILKEQVSILQLVPSILRVLVAEPEFERCRSLKGLFSGGESLSTQLKDRMLDCLDVRLHNLYGPTEACIQTVVHSCGRGDINGAVSVPIGRPVRNTQLYVLDARMQPVPIGVPGELYIGGVQVGRGYLGRPDSTVQRFVADLFGNPGSRLYRTGDLVRYLPDGNLEFLGRIDSQVKIRGYRIELEEIEAQLARLEQVKEVAVVVREDVPGEPWVVAYLTQHDQANLSTEELRAHLRAVLPEYMVPGAFVVLENLPLAPNGKLNRRALPVPAIDAYATQKYEAPQGDVETALARLWQEFLHAPRVGRDDNFFELGGHSLLAVQVLFKINAAFSSSLKLTDLYRNSTIRELATRIEAGAAEHDFVDLSQEAVLRDGIVAKAGHLPESEEVVLLTGATGFVGRFLLAQLLRDTRAAIHCLVRTPSKDQALLSLRTTLAKWDLWRDEFEPRILAVPCDLRRPYLGIDGSMYEVLSKSVDTIYHCATSMNHLETYEMAKAANVESARELLEFATKERPKLINYVSTLGVFSPSSDGARVVHEMSSIDQERHPISSGYTASKWVAEKIFMKASERGIPCNIFRLGLIWADTHLGRFDERQREYMVLKSALLSGVGIQNYQYDTDPVPVDHAARAMVFLASRHRDGRGIFHIASSSQTMGGLFERYNEIAGTSFEIRPHYDWICEIKRRHYEGRSLPVVPLVEFAFSMDESSFHDHQRQIQSGSIQFDCSQTSLELDRAGIVTPILSDELLKVCLESMIARDWELQDFATRSTGLLLQKREGVHRWNA